MKVLHVDTGKPWRGGQAQVYELLRVLAELEVDCHLMCTRGGALARRVRDQLQSVTVHEHALRGEWDLGAARRVAALHRAHGFDVLHAHSGHAHGIAAIAVAVHRGLPPLVVTRRLELEPKDHALNRWKYAKPARMIGISDAVCHSIKRLVEPARRVRIPSGQNLAAVKAIPRDDRVRRELGLPGHALMALNVGALSPQKDQATLLRGFAAAIKHETLDDPPLHLVIAGEGDKGPTLEALIDELKLNGRAHLVGFVDEPVGLIKSADLFVLSSVFEGLCSTLVQVMASKVPVVATAVGGVVDLIADGHTGRTVPPRDAPALAGAIRAWRAERGTERWLDRVIAARDLAEHFDWDTVLGPATLEVYREVAATRG